MKKIILSSITAILLAMPLSALADVTVLSGSLDYNTPPAQTLTAASQNFDAARITLTANNGDVYLTAIRVGTDVAGGLSNFNSIYIYDTGNGNLIGAYPTGSQNPDLIQFTPLAIGLGRSKTFLVRVSGLSSSAAGTVRIGFLDFTYATSPAPQLSNVPIYGNTLTLPGVVSPSPTAQMSPTPSPSSAASGSPAQSPSTTPATITVQQLPVLSTAVKTQIRLLRDGDLIRANNGPSVWIIRRTTAKISKRWVINLEIFKANNYSFSRVKVVDPLVLGVIPTSYLIRKSGDTKIYELTNVSEFGGTLKRWIRTADDFISMGYDFEAVYLVNEREFNLYSSGPDIYKK